MAKGKYVNFDLAWRSDNATVIKLAYPNGIYTFSKGKIKWRVSKDNISFIDTPQIHERKVKSTILFFNWVYSFFSKNKEKYPLKKLWRNIIFERSLKESSLKQCLMNCNQLTQVKSFSDRLIIIIYYLYTKLRYGEQK